MQYSEAKLLTLLCLSAACLWSFVELADWVLDGQSHAIDEKLLLLFRTQANIEDPLGPLWLEDFIRDLTALGSVGILSLLTLLCMGYLLLEQKKRLALLLMTFIASGILASFALKTGFTRPRPDLVPHATEVYTSSFPSGHSMLSSLVYLTLASLGSLLQSRRRNKAYLYCTAVLLSVVVGLSRVYLGVHWPTDVLAGWTMGTVWALLFLLISRTGIQSGWLEPADAMTSSRPARTEKVD
ncbi:phosphatase PAP2 family protein [Bowmanella dokdonensis]|uniref:undecaprenyl-diphosphate phosphatase n=1 Tax=Bowmanella dokdonensis TaxID=751969 RepID=A0A939ISZ5_9ALTE|nr:phosphatase PAP2 family protein [Bowmanella dokdonensis]